MKSWNSAFVSLFSVATFALLAVTASNLRAERGRTTSLRDELTAVQTAREGSRPIQANELRGLDGTLVPVGSTRAETYLLFFSPRCPYCEEEARGWNELFREMAVDGLDFLGVATVDEGVAEFAERHRFEFPVVFGKALQDELAIPAVPYAVLLDRRGRPRLQDSELCVLAAKRGGFAEAIEDWPAPATEEWLTALCRTLVSETETVGRIALQDEGEPLYVLEGGGAIRGYARTLTAHTRSMTTSDLDCLALLGADGEPLAVLPLRVHRDAHGPIPRAQLEEWARPRALTAPADWRPLERVLRRELTRLRLELGFSPLVTAAR